MARIDSVMSSRRRFLRATGGAGLVAAAGLEPLANLARAASPSPGAAAPAFSWDHVPAAAILGKPTGDFSALEAAFIGGHFSFIALEPTGMPNNPPGQNFVEVGAARNAHLLKSANPQIKILIAWDWQGTVANYQAYARPDYDPAWRLAKHNHHIHDITNQAFRQWWANAAASMVDRPELDGIYVDGIADDVANPSVLDLLQRLRRALDALSVPKLVITSASGQGALPGDPLSLYNVADGEAIVHFAEIGNGTPDTMRANMNQMAALALAGKIVLFKAWPKFIAGDPTEKVLTYGQRLALARRNIGFPLACFLAAAQPHCYFQYGWGFNNDEGTYVLHDAKASADRQMVDASYYSELLQPLGPPLGNPAIRGYEYTRRFQHAALRVNVQTRQVAINWA
jgi:hypothetical protein